MDDLAAIDQIEDLLADGSDDPERGDVDQVADLIAGNDSEGSQAVEPTGDGEPEQETELDAEPAVEIPDGVDYSAEIPMSDGSKQTLGALKDAYQDQQRISLEVQERENALMTQMNELQAMSQHVQLPPERLEAIRVQQEQYLTQEHGRMLEAIPEFKDQGAFAEAKKGIDALAVEYGIQDQVANIADHRIVKLLNDFAKLRQGIRTAKDNVKPLRSKDPKARNRSAGKVDAVTQAANRAAQSGSKSDRIAAVSALLK